MKGLILAAGKGSRLAPRTESVHKCLTEVRGTPILSNMLDSLQHPCEEVTIVHGYLGDQIQEHVGDNWKGLPIRYADNLLYETTNTSYSLWRGIQSISQRDVITSPLLVLEADVFFESSLLAGFLQNSNENRTVVEKHREGLDGSYVQIDEFGHVADWIHTTRRKEHFDPNQHYKTVNLHLFQPSFLQKKLLPILKSHVEISQGKEPLEYVFEDVVHRTSSESIYAWNATKFKWAEIDDEADLRIAEEIFRYG